MMLLKLATPSSVALSRYYYVYIIIVLRVFNVPINNSSRYSSSSSAAFHFRCTRWHTITISHPWRLFLPNRRSPAPTAGQRDGHPVQRTIPTVHFTRRLQCIYVHAPMLFKWNILNVYNTWRAHSDRRLICIKHNIPRYTRVI